MNTETRAVARIFEDVGGYHICNDADTCLTTSAFPCATKADALRCAWRNGFTHAIGSGCPWDGVRAIPARYQVEYDRPQHLEENWYQFGQAAEV